MDYADKIILLANLIKSSGKVLALTGAGISTESGIPDFRSKDWLWNKIDPDSTSLPALLRSPETFYKQNLPWWQQCIKAKPNTGHLALAALEKQGWLLGVITQNIDGLHQRAGTKRIWEIHGNLNDCSCINCKNTFPISQLYKSYVCCHCGGLIRPAVVLFEDTMPEAYFTAEKVLSGCQLLLVIGSSLQVYPAAALTDLAQSIVIINNEETPKDDQAVLVIREHAGKVLKDLLGHFTDQFGPYPVSM